MGNKRVLFLCVDYKSESDTLALYRDVQKQSVSDEIEFLVVCNSGSQNLMSLVQFDESVSMTIEDARDNIGYFPAAHRSATKYFERFGVPDYLVVSNADVSIFDENLFENLFKIERKYSVIAPNILTPSGIRQNPFMTKRPRRFQLLFLNFVFSNWPLYWGYSRMSFFKNIIRGKTRIVKSNSISQEIYAPHGSFIIFSEKYFNNGGSLNHQSFLYGEELFVGEMSNRNNLKVLFQPKLSIIHNEHAVTGSIGSKRKSKYLSEATKSILNYFY